MNLACMDVEREQLLYFLAIAEEQCFTRAAARLQMSAPPLRQQMSRLERRLGVCLFRRTPRGLALTPAGLDFVGAATEVLSQPAPAVAPVRQFDDCGSAPLRIGVVASAMWGPVATLLRDYHTGFPRFRWTIREAAAEDLLDALAQGQIDIGFWREPALGPEALQRHRLCQRLYYDEGVAVALSESHRLAELDAVALAELAAEEMLALPSDGSSFYRYLARCCETAGFTPRVTREAANLPTLLAMVSNRMGIALMPESMARIQWPGVVFIGLHDTPSANLYVAYGVGNAPDPLRAFIQVLNKPFRPG